MSKTNDTIISVNNLSKIFKIYDKPIDMLMEIITNKKRHNEFHALKNISFSVNRGEVVGVIGRNGAGKSTLLRILAGTLDPTSGSYKINGKISAILELGTGFHGEYTGRENIYMGGMCLGMTRNEIDQKIDGIIDFSGLNDVIDRQFKTYSSGMKARLTFSVALSVNPDLLIIDEALAAGDGVFIAKSFKRISEICKSGATVFFVTHSTDLVRRLCNRCIYFKNGEIYLDGSAENISSIYDIDILEITSSSIQTHNVGSKAGDGAVQITNIEILDGKRQKTNGFFQHDKMIINLDINCLAETENPAFWIKFTRADGVIATSWLSHEPTYNDLGTLQPGCITIELTIEDLLLGDGNFDLTVAVFPKRSNKYDTAFYVDPMCIWDKTHKIVVQRKSRPLSTIYDQDVTIKVIHKNRTLLNNVVEVC